VKQLHADLEAQVADLCFRGSIGVKSLSKRAPCDGRANAESTWKKWRTICFIEQIDCLQWKLAIHLPTCQCSPTQIHIYLIILKISAFPWPAQCPNLNTIENVLLRMNSQMNADSQGLLRHKHQLTEGVFEEWRKSPAVVIKQLWHPLQSDFQPLLQHKWLLHNVLF